MQRFWYTFLTVAKKESLFWKKVRMNLKSFILVRIESWTNHGIPDVLGVSPGGVYFTVELKVTESKKVSFSPHQIAYHKLRENAPAFILVQGLKTPALLSFDQGSWSEFEEAWTKVLE